MARFYDTEKGSIIINGMDIKDIRLEDLRNLMGIVSQRSILFNDTIYNNILIGNLNAKTEEVYRAAEAANAHDFILEKPKGYQTNIGDKGDKLVRRSKTKELVLLELY